MITSFEKYSWAGMLAIRSTRQGYVFRILENT